MLAILMYHFIKDPNVLKKLNLKGISEDQFIKQLKFLKKNYDIISYQDLDYILKKKNKNKYALLTFDDGYIEHYNFVLPELLSANVKGIFSIPLVNFNLKNNLLDINKIQILSNSTKLQDKIIKKIYFYFNKKKINKEKLKEKFYINGRLDGKKTNFIKKTLQLGYDIDGIKVSDIIFDYFYKNKIKKNYSNLYFKKIHLNEFKKNDMTFCAHGITHNKFTNLNTSQLDLELSKSTSFLKKYNKNKKFGVVYPHGLSNKTVIQKAVKNGYYYGFAGGKSLINNINKIEPMNMTRVDTVDFDMVKYYN